MRGRNLVKRPWQVLCGAEPRFKQEPALSLFAIKYWLTNHIDDMRLSFGRATAIYGLWYFQDFFKRNRTMSYNKKMSLALKDRNNALLFDECMARGLFLDALGIPDIWNEVENRQELYSDHWRAEIEFIECRLRSAKYLNDFRLQTSEELYEAYRIKDGDDKIIGLSLLDRYKGYRNRSAYLVSAYWTLPDLLKFQTDVLRSLADSIPSPDDFKAFIGEAKEAAQMLRPKDERLSESIVSTIDRLTGVQARPLSWLKPLPPDVILKREKSPRRSPSETKRGRRQKPVTEKR